MPQKIIEPIDKINNFLKYFFKFPSDHIILKKEEVQIIIISSKVLKLNMNSVMKKKN